MPEGQIIARNGEIGVQARTLMPGLYWRLPIVWSFAKVPVVMIDTDSVGIVESIDGEPLPKGRVLADEVECNQFQDAEMFLANHGKKGPQVGILRPGTYRINSKLFNITKAPAVTDRREHRRHRRRQRRHSLADGLRHRPEGPKRRWQRSRPQGLSERAALHRQQGLPGTAAGYAAAGHLLHQPEPVRHQDRERRRGASGICGGDQVQRGAGVGEGAARARSRHR